MVSRAAAGCTIMVGFARRPGDSCGVAHACSLRSLDSAPDVFYSASLRLLGRPEAAPPNSCFTVDSGSAAQHEHSCPVCPYMGSCWSHVLVYHPLEGTTSVRAGCSCVSQHFCMFPHARHCHMPACIGRDGRVELLSLGAYLGSGYSVGGLCVHLCVRAPFGP